MDERASTIAALHRRYGGIIYDLCLRMLSERAEAEDAVQETFVSAFRALETFCYGDSHLPWLYRIGVNTCLKALRTRKRRRASLVEYISDIPATQADPVDSIHYRRALEGLLASLNERDAEIVAAHYVAGMDQGQIAEQLGISRRAVVKRLARLRDRLAGVFDQEDADG